jgi:hypothetical protein
VRDDAETSHIAVEEVLQNSLVRILLVERNKERGNMITHFVVIDNFITLPFLIIFRDQFENTWLILGRAVDEIVMEYTSVSWRRR